jgi:hypothetical protein
MSSSDQDTKLAYWLPKLEVYRAAMEASPEAPISIPEAAEDEISAVADTSAKGLEEAVVSLPQGEQALELPVERIEKKQPIEVIPHVPALSVHVPALSVHVGEESTLLSHDSESRAALPQVLHLPIDGILRKLKGLKPFVLGIGTVGKSETQWSRQVVRDAVNRCCDKTGRNAVLVSVRPSGYSDTSESASQSDRFRVVDWTYFGDSKAETKAWHAQLSDLPKWKKEFGLIVFDLGDVRLPTMPRIGRLCDGIVVQLLNAANSRDTIQALRGLQKDRLKILGVWSVELNARSIAA